tara:strand:- start:1800 stop:2036 length:237 start_codon:yes stop_codon:yes gene_type:complete
MSQDDSSAGRTKVQRGILGRIAAEYGNEFSRHDARTEQGVGQLSRDRFQLTKSQRPPHTDDRDLVGIFGCSPAEKFSG